MNKKAEEGNFLGEHVLNIIIGVVCIVLLLFLAHIIYNLFTKSDDLRVAENNLKNFVSEYQSFYDDKSIQTKDFLIYGPKDWYLIIYLKGNLDLPDKLYNSESDIACICDGDKLEDCINEKTGICMGLGREWFNNTRVFEIDKVPYSIGADKSLTKKQ
jgi:hypothetical protein